MSEIYILCAGQDYYPRKGLEDLIATFVAVDDEQAEQIATARLDAAIRADTLLDGDPDWWTLDTLDTLGDVRHVLSGSPPVDPVAAAARHDFYYGSER